MSTWVLQHLLDKGVNPLALLVPAQASHAEELRAMCPSLAEDRVLVGRRFAEPAGVELLRALALDYVIGVHFPLLVPDAVLELPKHGVLNLHPAYLPWGRGWHTPSWAILEDTPVGATLHFMDSGVDTGDIVDQQRLEVSPGDTADSLYRRLKQMELELFERAWPALAEGTYQRRPQESEGTTHRRQDLLEEDHRRIPLDATTTAGDLLRTLRALTTDRREEAAFYELDGRRFRVTVEIDEE